MRATPKKKSKPSVKPSPKPVAVAQSATPQAGEPSTVLELELASRVLARRRLTPFILRINPKYLVGWVHEDICRRLEKFSADVAAGKNPRLMLLMPPRHGKSEIASRNFPAWHMGQYPDHEIISCSYNVSLAMGFSRKVKQIIEDPSYTQVFPNARLDPKNQSTEEWALEGARGGYVAAGIGGPITGKGAHCLSGETIISTVAGDSTLEHLYLLKSIPDVNTPFGPRRVMAATRDESEDVYRLTFASGAVLTATGKHPIFDVASGYRSVEDIYGAAQNDGGVDVHVLREAVRAAEVRSPEVGTVGVDRVLLQQNVQPGAPRGEERQEVRRLYETSGSDHAVTELEILLPGLSERGIYETLGADLPTMRRGVSAEAFKAGLLRQELRQYGAQDTDDWSGELPLQGRQFLRILIQPDEAAGAGEGRGLRGMRDGAGSGLPSPERGCEGQHSAEPDNDVPPTSRHSSQVQYDTLRLVERLSGERHSVYDLQVEDAGCFFAGGILVGNCLIIDDPVKNAEEADSADQREKVKEWYNSTAYTRLAPGGGVLIIQTWWHDDDLAGWLQTMMKEGHDDEHVDQFQVIKYPAIAEHDEWLDPETDLIVDEKPDHPDARLLRHKGEPLHEARYDLDKLLRIKAQNKGGRWWSALYQQNPVPDDGAYFLKEHFRRGQVPQKEKCNVYIAWDFAISEKKQSDYTVGTVGLQDDDDVLHVADQVRFKSGDAFFIVEAILNLSERWYSPNLLMGFEDGQIWRAIEALLKKRMKERRIYPSIVVLKPITDKMARARPLQGRMQQGMVSFSMHGEWYDSCRMEMLRFPAGVHDDQVDSLAWMTTMAIGRQPPMKPKHKEPPSWRDKLKLSSNQHGHMGV